MDLATRVEGEAKLLETACDRERVAIIFNPASGSEDSETRRTTLEELARAAGLSCELTETDQDQGAAPLAQQAVADGMERVLVSGGDGSVMEAAGAVAGTGVALAVLPGGTANLLSHNLGLPTDAEAAMRVALTGEARPMDVGRANGTVFTIMAGMGMDAAMVRDADRELKDRLGVLAYFVAVLRNIRRPPLRYLITIDGRRLRRRAQTVLVANLGRITGGVELVLEADPGDGRLEVAILRAHGLWDLAVLAGRTLLKRQRGDPRLEVHRGRQIVIETGSPQPVQLDGNEVPPTTRLEIHVEPGALQIVRAPDAPEAQSYLAPAAPAVLSQRPNSTPLAVWGGIAVITLLCLRAWRDRAQGRSPALVPLHPIMAGLAAGIIVWLLPRWRRRRSNDAPVSTLGRSQAANEGGAARPLP
jgi:diacylglycerol kinase (ATP)